MQDEEMKQNAEQQSEQDTIVEETAAETVENEAASPEAGEQSETESGKKSFFGKKEKPEVLKAKLEAAQKENEELKERLMRTAAEYENFRKRSTKEKDESFNHGVSHAVTQILSILDTLEMALNAPCSDEAYKKGVEMTLSKAAEALKNLNVEEIEALNQPFDPNLMNAVQQMPAQEGQESGSVVMVYQKGYRIGEKVIRHATVVVAE